MQYPKAFHASAVRYKGLDGCNGRTLFHLQAACPAMGYFR